jgi:glycosyltransferase involved in cell wall biosynthesis
MKNLLIITQKVEQNDDLLGFFVDWISEFSKYFDHIYVITLLEGEHSLPDNVSVYSLGKEYGSSKFYRLAKFYKLLIKLLPKSVGVFAHMSPIFAVASWPIAFIFRKKIILWYLHRSVTVRLRVAGKLCYKIITATKESLKLKSKKIVEIGHGINIDRFRTEKDWPEKRLNILSVGRISPIKNYETLIYAISYLEKKSEISVKIIGRPIMPGDFTYYKKLKGIIENMRLDIVQFIGLIPYPDIPDYYRDADLVINLAPPGGLDKVVLEAMASGCIVLTSNSSFAKYFGPYKEKLVFNFADQDELAKKIQQIRSMSLADKKEVSDFMVRSVKENHGLEDLINKIHKFYECE